MKVNYKFRKIFTFLLVITVFLGTVPFSAVASSPMYYDFANFTEDDCMDFIEECDINIPTKLMQLDDLPAFTQSLILQSYNHPDIQFCFNYGATQTYAEEIRSAVRSYMDLSVVSEDTIIEIDDLQFNTVKNEDGDWVTSNGDFDYRWKEYNCYAYAINRQERSLHYESWNQPPYEPGDMGNSGNFDTVTSILELAQIVKQDLLAMSYSNISISSTLPTINSSQELICVRMNEVDYHFMRYDLDTNAWYHKPGNTAVLKYNYIPSNSLIWYKEVSFYGEEYSAPGYYDSDILFITYSKKQINVDTDGTSREFIQVDKDILCELNFENAGNFDLHINSQECFNYEIYDADFRKIVDDLGQTSVTLYFPTNATKYYLRVNFSDRTVLSYVDISINLHTQHSYTTCEYMNHFCHQLICACGETKIAAHYISGSHVGEDFVPCGGCGYLLDMRDDIHQGIMSITQVSVNGSYIRSDGIVVLVDEDIEAYLAGTLQFYHPEDVPVTQ